MTVLEYMEHDDDDAVMMMMMMMIMRMVKTISHNGHALAALPEVPIRTVVVPIRRRAGRVWVIEERKLGHSTSLNVPTC